MKNKYLTTGIILVLFCLFFSCNSFAQPASRRFSISIIGGTTSKGPASDLESALNLAGYNDVSSFWGSTTAHPFSKTGLGAIGSPWLVQCQYLLNGNLAVSMIVSNSDIGMTLGYKKSSYFSQINYSVLTISPLLSISLNNIFRIGAGPAYYITKANNESSSIFGGLLDIGLSVPNDSRFYFTFSFQYRFVGKMDLSEVKENYPSSKIIPIGEVNFNHTFTGIGIGIRF